MASRFQETKDQCYAYFLANDIHYDTHLDRDEVFNTLMSVDTSRALNCQWIFHQYRDGHFLLSDIDEVRDVIQMFYRNKGKITKGRRKLIQYSYPEVLAIISSFPLYTDRVRSNCKGLFDRVENDDGLFSTLMSADPEGGRNCRWLFDQYRNKQFLLEDVNRVRNDIKLFLDNRVSLPLKERALGRYSYTELKRLVVQWDLTNYTFVPIIGDNPDIVILSHTGHGKLSMPKTEEASCIVGSGTKWCTAARVSYNMFEYYNERGPLYVWEDYHLGKKYQFHFEEMQFMDNMDDPIDHKDLHIFRNEHPILSKFFRNREKEIIMEPELAYKYAKDVLHGAWKDAEPMILKDPSVAVEYARDVLADRWPEAEPIIMEDPLLAYDYAHSVIQEPWPEAEPTIMEDPSVAYEYAMNVLGRRWPEAEPIILTDTYATYAYTMSVVQERWEEAEPVIMEDDRYWESYQSEFL